MADKKPPMKRIGTMNCFTCDREGPVKEQSNGLAAFSCAWCGYQSYARGEESDANLRKKMKPIAQAAASPSPASSPGTPSKDQKKEEKKQTPPAAKSGGGILSRLSK